jgi:hypothetical protein
LGCFADKEGQMQKEISEYIDACKENAKQKISLFLSSDNAIQIAQKTFSFYFGEKSLPFE